MECECFVWKQHVHVSICLHVRPPGRFSSHGCIVLSKCLDRKERCDTGRTRKLESDSDFKNRKQEETPITWPLRCTLGFIPSLLTVCSRLNYRELRVSDQGHTVFILDR